MQSSNVFFYTTILAVSSSLIFSIVIPVAPYINEIIGQSKLKNANGKNAKHPTPRVADIYAPHVFHGISEEVIVALDKEYEEYLIACETNYTEYDYLNNRKEFYKHEKEI